MIKILGVRFRSCFKIIYYKVDEADYKINDGVICETQNGLEFGKICYIKNIDDMECEKKANIDFTKGFIRIATEEDVKQNNNNLKWEEQAVEIGRDCVKKYDLEMKFILLVSSFDRSKLIFLFTANGRVDFRKFVRHLASIFKTRVELRQIGIRDEAKILGGIGMCGRVFCCSSYLNEFNHVSIKMAKDQNLSLNPRKISGCCGRLMCCLQHEQEAYTYLNSQTPGIGDRVSTAYGTGVVIGKNLLLGEFKVKLDEFSNSSIKILNAQHIKKISE